MFKKIGLIIFVSALAVVAQAEQTFPNPQPARPSRFEELLEQFSKGTTPSKDEMIGRTKGVCFYKSTPNVAAQSQLVVRVREGLAQGPLFPTPKYFEFAFFRGHGEFLDDHILEWTTSGMLSDAWVSLLKEHNLKFVIRKGERYLFGLIFNLKDSESRKTDELAASCYFFEKKNK